MTKDFDTVLGSNISDQRKIKDEFLKENSLMFEFDFLNPKEEKGALEQLEEMLLGASDADSKNAFERMEALVKLFGGYSGEPVERCGRLPEESFSKDDIPRMFGEEMSRITGIKFPLGEEHMSWDVGDDVYMSDYSEPREFFLNNGLVGWDYLPKSRMPGERWRMHRSQVSHEVSAVFQRFKVYREGYLIVEERLTRWGLVMWTSTKIQEFVSDYSDRPDEWKRILLVLDVCEDDIRTMAEFTSGMKHLNPVSDLIPIRVLEVITVFRVLFRLSLQEFEKAYDGMILCS